MDNPWEEEASIIVNNNEDYKLPLDEAINDIYKNNKFI